jgi:hypothetical protein
VNKIKKEPKSKQKLSPRYRKHSPKLAIRGLVNEQNIILHDDLFSANTYILMSIRVLGNLKF